MSRGCWLGRCLLLVGLVCQGWTSVALAAGTKEAPRVVPPQQWGVGRRLPDLPLPAAVSGANGSARPRVLSEALKGNQAVVLALTSTSCPITKKTLANLAALEAEFAARGVRFVWINPIATDDAASIRKAVEQHQLQGLYLQDTTGDFVAALGAESTAECWVVDAQQTVIYRGAVDDQYGLGYSLAAPRKPYLREALEDLLKGQPIRVPATTAPGCVLDRKPSSFVELSPVTYHNRISRLIATHCQECHREGGVGPFPLETYEQVVSHKGMIRKVVDAGTMPPWHAAPETTFPGRWANDRSLTPDDKADLLSWLSKGVPAGDPAQAPRPPVFYTDWKIGHPDQVVSLPKPIRIPATGVMDYQYVLVDPKVTEDRWLQAYEIQPTDAGVVHHVLVHLVLEEDGGPLLGLKLLNRLAERRGPFAAYVPGNAALRFPDGFAKKLPKNAKLIFQIHYTPNGTATEDQLRLGMVFAKEAPQQEVRVSAVVNTRIKIPPMEANHVETAISKARIPEGAYLTAFMPHTHVRGKACKYELVKADGTTELLLDVPHYDFNWQLRYELAKPFKLPPGSRIRFTVVYDNSPGNPANPDPKATVTWGEQTRDEMMLGYLEFFYERPTPSSR